MWFLPHICNPSTQESLSQNTEQKKETKRSILWQFIFHNFTSKVVFLFLIRTFPWFLSSNLYIIPLLFCESSCELKMLKMEFLHPLYCLFLSQDDLNHCQHCPGSSGGTGIITQTYNTVEDQKWIRRSGKR